MLSKKIICVVAAAAIVLSLFSGCGKNTLQNIEIPSENNVSETKDTPNPEMDSKKQTSSDAKQAESTKNDDTKKDTSKNIFYLTGAANVPIYSDDFQSGEVLAELSAGSAVELKEYKGETVPEGYSYVYSPDKKVSGWVNSDYFVGDKAFVTKGDVYTVKSENTELFGKANKEDSFICMLYSGEEVTVLAKTGGGQWKVVTSNGYVGYIAVNALEENSASVQNQELTTSSSANGTSSNNTGGETYTYTYTYGGDGGAGNGGGSSGYVGGGSSVSNYDNPTVSSNPTEIDSDIPNSNTAVESNNENVSKPTATEQGDISETLNQAVSAARNNAGGNWSAAVIVPSSGDYSTVNDSQMQAASLIKLFIMGAVYENYDAYSSQDSGLDTYLYNMITVSDNYAANHLVGLLGGGDTDAGRHAVTAYCQSHGYGYTSMGRLLLESTINGDNYTSTGDCARFLLSVYNNELPHSSEMMSLLKQQTRTSKIPAGVPYGVTTANKTGELDLVQNDAAVVFAGTPYILCVMSENVGAGAGVRSTVSISSSVYNSLN